MTKSSPRSTRIFVRRSSERRLYRFRSRSSSRASTARTTFRAVGIARASAEYREVGSGATLGHRARFFPGDVVKLRDLFEIVGRFDACDVLVDDRPIPYARELWLPLMWFLIPR